MCQGREASLATSFLLVRTLHEGHDSRSLPVLVFCSSRFLEFIRREGVRSFC
jgi:hypothetical protein